jgi:hypothetical protein
LLYAPYGAISTLNMFEFGREVHWSKKENLYKNASMSPVPKILTSKHELASILLDQKTLIIFRSFRTKFFGASLESCHPNRFLERPLTTLCLPSKLVCHPNRSTENNFGDVVLKAGKNWPLFRYYGQFAFIYTYRKINFTLRSFTKTYFIWLIRK